MASERALTRIEQLLEAMNSRAEVSWSSSKGEEHGDFTVGGTKYRITLAPDRFDGFKIISASFKVLGGTSHATRFMKDQFHVLGAVYNGVLDKVSTMKFDGLWFSAKKDFSLVGDHETRVSLYKRLSQRLEKKKGWHYTSIDDDGDIAYIVSPSWKFIEHIEKIEKE